MKPRRYNDRRRPGASTHRERFWSAGRIPTLALIAWLTLPGIAAGQSHPPASRTLLNDIRAEPHLRTFVDLTERAGLSSLLDVPLNWTVFVPRDDAFDNILIEASSIDRNGVENAIHSQWTAMRDGAWHLALWWGASWTQAWHTPQSFQSLIETGFGPLLHARDLKVDSVGWAGDELFAWVRVTAETGQRVHYRYQMVSESHAWRINGVSDYGNQPPPVTLDLPGLRDVLARHIVPGEFTTNDFDGQSIPTLLSGTDVTLTRSGATYFVDNTKALDRNNRAVNGVWHLIDQILPGTQPLDIPANIVDLAFQAGDFSTLLAALNVADLTSALETGGPWTVLAPTDAAFDRLDPEILETLLENPGLLAEILTYHVIEGAFSATELRSFGAIDALNAAPLEFGPSDFGGLSVNHVPITSADLGAANGIVHVIEEVLIPPGFKLPDPKLPSIARLATETSDLSTLANLLRSAGLEETLDLEGPYTVFAPTNEAFARLDNASLQALGANRDKLVELLLYHVVPGENLAEHLLSGRSIETLNGAPIHIARDLDGTVLVDGASLRQTDILAENGVVHIVNDILIPAGFQFIEPPKANLFETAQSGDDFSLLTNALRATGLDSALKNDGPFTVFAPTDAAFQKLPQDLLAGLLSRPEKLQDVLLYHVIAARVLEREAPLGVPLFTLNGLTVTADRSAGGNLLIEGVRVSTTDILASNGVIHVLDHVLIPPGFQLIDNPQLNLVETALANEAFSTLVTAVEVAGLVDALTSDEPLTVLAPTNEAFGRLPEGVLAALLENPKKLQEVLLYHVVEGAVVRDDLPIGTPVDTLNGASFTADLGPGARLSIGEAEITQTDILATNGVIHVLDNLLLPPGFELNDRDTRTLGAYILQEPDFTTLSLALSLTGLDETLNSEGSFTLFAPTNEAFAALSPDLWLQLLIDPDQVSEILLGHVLLEEIGAEELPIGSGIDAANGVPLVFEFAEEAPSGVRVNDVAIVGTDTLVANGVLHIIDAVLTPGSGGESSTPGMRIQRNGESVELIMQTEGGKTYQAQSSSDLRRWSTFDTIEGDGDVHRQTIPMSGEPSALFFRMHSID